MAQSRRQVPRALMIAAVLAAGPGCLSFNRRPIALPPECTSACAEVPCPCRNDIYVFLLSGFDPLDLDRVTACRSTLIGAGFTKVYNGQFYHEQFFAREMQRLAAEDPHAKFVVIGFSLGVEAAVSLAEIVGKQGVPITLLASVDPYWWSSAPGKSPPGVEQVMTIHGERLLPENRAAVGTDVQVPATFPFNVTAHPVTVETLVRSLAQIGGTLPKPPSPPMPPEAVGDHPTPRPVEQTDRPRDAWDFLKPVASLRSVMPNEALAGSPASGEHTALRPTQP